MSIYFNSHPRSTKNTPINLDCIVTFRKLDKDKIEFIGASIPILWYYQNKVDRDEDYEGLLLAVTPGEPIPDIY